MPGGYDSYLVSLRRVVEYVESAAPTPEQLQSWMREELAITPGSAYARWRSLCRAGLFSVVDGRCRAAPACTTWLRDLDPAQLMEEIHRNIRFVGELLALLEVPLSAEALRDLANGRYQMGWQRLAQVNFRRGWLQSARMLDHENETGVLKRTAAGSALLVRLELETPIA